MLLPENVTRQKLNRPSKLSRCRRADRPEEPAAPLRVDDRGERDRQQQRNEPDMTSAPAHRTHSMPR